MTADSIRAVAFDVFGTLVRITDPRHPYRTMLNWGQSEGLEMPENPAAFVMTKPGDLESTARRLGWKVPRAMMRRWKADLAAELGSIRLFDDAAEAMVRLRDAGFRVGLCSNLASPYAKPLVRLLPFEPRPSVFSFDAGAVKPDPSIYASVALSFGLSAREILFIGDSWEADVEGPQRFGMHARAVNAAGRARLPIADLL